MSVRRHMENGFLPSRPKNLDLSLSFSKNNEDNFLYVASFAFLFLRLSSFRYQVSRHTRRDFTDLSMKISHIRLLQQVPFDFP